MYSEVAVDQVEVKPNHCENTDPSNVEAYADLIDFITGRDALIEEIRNNDVTVLLGETGSGKTTRKCVFLFACDCGR